MLFEYVSKHEPELPACACGEQNVMNSTANCGTFSLSSFQSLGLFWCPCAQLQGMNASFPCHFLLEQCIDHAVPRWLHLRFECIRHDRYREMRLGRYAPCHCPVMRVFGRIVANVEVLRLESFIHLQNWSGRRWNNSSQNSIPFCESHPPLACC